MILGLATIVGTVSAAVLTYYGKITGTVNVSQSVLVDGLAYPESKDITYTFNGVGGGTYTSYHTLKNQAPVPAIVRMDTSVSAVDSEGHSISPEGVTVTYQLVTTPFGKRGATAEWTTEQAYSGEYSVKMHIPQIPEGTYNIGALVQIPITPVQLDGVPSFDTMTFKVKGDTDVATPYYQLKIDLRSDDFGRFVVLTPAEYDLVDGEWLTGVITADSWYCWSFAGEGLEGPKSLAEWHDEFTDGDGVLDYPNYRVLFVNVQYGWMPTTSEGTVYVDYVTYGDTIWDLEWDALQSVDLTAIWNDNYVVIPSDYEILGFTITVSLAINAQAGTYTIETRVTAIP